MSRIYYNGKFFDYPLRAVNALKGLGLVEATRCVGSYVWARVRPPADTTTFEGWTASRFGWRLYRIFFKTYTEKVWGVPASQIQADWAAQRIKNLSLGKAIVNSLLPKRNQTEITSLIEEFQYPKYGPGMMWEVCRDKVVEPRDRRADGDAPSCGIEHADGRARTVVVAGADGVERLPATQVISSMPTQRAACGPWTRRRRPRCSRRPTPCATATSSPSPSSCPSATPSPTTGSTSTRPT